jgi:hypothetical protein
MKPVQVSDGIVKPLDMQFQFGISAVPIYKVDITTNCTTAGIN